MPGIGQTVAPVLWFLFSAWMLAIQYCDYPFDNHKVPFKEMRTALRSQKVANMQFGALTSLFTMIPVPEPVHHAGRRLRRDGDVGRLLPC
jgi:CysZ protein